jgi:uncharacterized membrane protein
VYFGPSFFFFFFPRIHFCFAVIVGLCVALALLCFVLGVLLIGIFVDFGVLLRGSPVRLLRAFTILTENA